MLGGEAMGPGTFSKIAAGFQANHGLDDQAVAFWIVHDTADTDHSNLGRELLDQFAPSDAEREQVLATVKRHMGIAFHLYDQIYEAVHRVA